jgi:cbb3-type cytochrome oxidase subunit 3
LAFAALFLEYQYRLASGTASLVLGLLSIPPLMVGGILSGIIVKRLKYRINDCLKFLAVVLLVNIVVYAGFMIYCKEPNMIPNLSVGQDLSLITKNNSKTYEIAQNCNCNRKIFKPVCLTQSDDIFFQTACLAGCTDFDRQKDQFMKCTQEMDSFNLIEQDNSTYANFFTSGLCPTRDCDLKLVISYMCIFFLMFLNALVFLPYLKVTIGSIDSKEMNPIGLGMKQFFMNGLGTIPGPILFGSVIDSTCTYWHTDQNDQRVCKIYNNQQFAFGFGILGVGFKTLCFILVIVSMIVLKKQKKAQNNNNNNNVEKK